MKETVIDACGGKADAVIIMSPPETVPLALDVLKYGGVAVPLGINLGGKNCISLDVNALIYHKHTIVPIYAEPAQKFPMSIELLKSGIVNSKDIVTHTFSLDDADAVLKQYKDKKAKILKAVLLMTSHTYKKNTIIKNRL